MDKFPARPQNNHWSARPNPSTALKPATFATPSRVGTTPTHHTPLDSAPSGQERASVVAMGGANNQSTTRRPGPSFNRKGTKPLVSEADKLFKMKMVEKSAEQVLSEKLKDVVYDANACRDLCPHLASAILNKIQGFSLKQYKLVCVVSVGSLREKPGVQFGSRCLWNKDTDNFVSVKYSNGSVYAVALIFGLYFE